MNDTTTSTSTMPRIVNLTKWLEDCTNLYVRLICNPVGIGFPDKGSPETIVHSVQKIIRVGNLDQVLQEHAQENIWRSWQLFADESCSELVSYIPLFIDIDNEKLNLDDAYSLTQDCLVWFERTNRYFAPDCLRIVFSGKKGFHIEARPNEAVDNQLIRDSLITGLREMRIEHNEFKNDFLKGTIDTLSHEFIRLTGSFNSWKEVNVLRKRKAIQLSLDEFRELGIKGIVAKSEAS